MCLEVRRKKEGRRKPRRLNRIDDRSTTKKGLEDEKSEVSSRR